MFNWIKKILRLDDESKLLRMNPIDALLKLNNGNMSTWNGVNFNRELMFDKRFTLTNTMMNAVGRRYFTDDQHELIYFIRVSFGKILDGPYSDLVSGNSYACDPAITMYINGDRRVICCEVDPRAPKIYSKLAKRILTEHMRNSMCFTCNVLFRTMINMWFSVKNEERYRCYAGFDGELDQKHLDILEVNLALSKKRYSELLEKQRNS